MRSCRSLGRQLNRQVQCSMTPEHKHNKHQMKASVAELYVYSALSLSSAWKGLLETFAG